MMEVLFLDWDSFGQEYIIKELKLCGCSVTMFSWNYKDENMRENENLRKILENKLNNKIYHFVFSVNFFPVAANACNNCGTKYVSWVYDSPFLLLYSKYLYCTTNYVFLFDYSQYNEFCERGIKTVYYLPMAAPVEDYDNIENTPAEQKIYNSDISFVGSTYKESNQDFMKLLDGVNDYTKGYLTAIMNMQHEIHGGTFLEEVLEGEVLDELRKVCPIERGEDEWETEAWIYANYFLARFITGQERMKALKLLGEKYSLVLYTPDNMLSIQGVDNRGVVDYIEEMPLVFKNSKINLNITLRSINSGIPLRAMDIMGNGGFLLTNFQEDFLKYFVPGEDYVYYTDEEDMVEKVAYYLEHEEERQQIALSGYKKVKKFHTYHHRVQTIFSIIFQEGELEIFDTIQKLATQRTKYGDNCWHQNINLFIKHPEKIEEEAVNKTFFLMKEERQHFFCLKNQLMDYINLLLKQKTISAWNEIVIWYNRKYSNELVAIFWEFDCIHTILNVYLEELQLYYRTGDLPKIIQYDSINIICKVYFETIFFLRRIEYGISSENDEKIIYDIQIGNRSKIFLKYIAQKAQVNNMEKIENFLQELLK